MDYKIAQRTLVCAILFALVLMFVGCGNQSFITLTSTESPARDAKAVFELDISMANFVQLKAELSRLVDRNADTIRFYRLGKNYKNQIEVIGKREDIELSQDNSIIL